jgi:hypothetical protein
MTSTPLRNSDYARLVIFVLLLLPIHVAAIIPVVLLVYSIISAKDNRDFSKIKRAVAHCKVYLWLVLVAVIIFQVFLILRGEKDLLAFVLIPIGIGIIYTKVLDKLFLEPLSLHQDWVQENGIFRKKEPKANLRNELNTRQAPLTSPADELKKLVQLKLEGHITAAEFEQLKKGLIGDK